MTRTRPRRAFGRLLAVLAVLAVFALVAVLRPGFAEDDAPGIGPAPRTEDPLATAAENTWPMRDGCPARTRAARTLPVLGPNEIVWTFKAPGAIVDEPRVWDDWVVVESILPSQSERCLDVLRLHDGKPVVERKTVKSTGSLDPVLWRDYVFIAAEGGTVETMRIVPELRILSGGRRFKAIESPLLLGNGEMIVRTATAIERRRVGQDEPLWTCPTEGWDPRCALSARDGWIYGLVVGADRETMLVSVSLATGRAVRGVSLGTRKKVGDALPYGAAISVGADELYLQFDQGFPSSDGRDLRGVRVRVGPNADRFEPSYLHVWSRPVMWRGASILAIDDVARGLRLVESVPSESGPPEEGSPQAWSIRVLAQRDRHPELVSSAAQGAVASGVVIGPEGAFDVETHRVLDAIADPRASRVVPARETLLTIDAEGILVARRSTKRDHRTGGPALTADVASTPAAVPQGILVGVDGSVRSGSFSISPKERKISGAGRDALAFDEVGLLLDKDGKILHGPDATFVARALPRVARRKSLPDFTALAKAAVATRSAAVLRQAVGDAADRGAKLDDVVLPLLRELTRLEHPTAVPTPPDPAKTAETARRREELIATEGRTLWTAFASLSDSVPFGYRTDVLRTILEVAPSHPEAAAWIKSRLPAGITLPGAPAADWLEVVDAAAATPVTWVTAKESGQMTTDERALFAARTSWRRDLVALRSSRLLIITPAEAPGRIARCLALGELVCDALEGLFGPVVAPSTEPLVIHLFATQKEYESKSPEGRGSGEGRAWIESSQGYYSPAAGLSRLFVPADQGAFRVTQPFLVHELAHHWLDRRLTVRPPPEEGSDRWATSGYFLEEGFATLLQEFVFDLRARTVSTLDPRSVSLDRVAHATKLLDWGDLLGAGAKNARELSTQGMQEVASGWTLDAPAKLSEATLFYAQSAAVCHYLLDANGRKDRHVLLEWIRDYFANRTKRDEVLARTGASAEELGKAVVLWSTAVSSAER